MFNLELTKEELSYIKNTLIHSFERPDLIRKIEVLEINDNVVADTVEAVNMPYVTERWPGGMLTNFPTIRKAVKKMATIDKLTNDGTYSNLSKREILQISRQRAKLDKTLDGFEKLNAKI